MSYAWRQLMDAPLRFAYADPPYIGCAYRYPEHPESGMWDDPQNHVELMRSMDNEYDGWALSCHEPSLRHLAAVMPDGARVAAWVKPFAAFKPRVRIAYAWEPVIWKRTAPRRDGDPIGRDFVPCNITLRKGFVGAKPESFCTWVLTLLGYQDGDELVDLFPGTGVMGRVKSQTRLSL